MYKPRTAREINELKIRLMLKKLEKRTVAPADVAGELNKRFERLKGENIGMYEELRPRYISISKQF